MQRNYYLLMLIFIIITSLLINYSIQQCNCSLKSSINVQSSDQTYDIPKNINPDNPHIKRYFQKVARVPYKANYKSNVPKKPTQFWKDNYGDCDDKSTAFADYLNRTGAEDVKIVIILHDSNKYSHCAVIWKNHIFDAAAEPPVYNMNQTKYFKFLKKMGFNLQITYTYSYYKKCYLQSSD